MDIPSNSLILLCGHDANLLSTREAILRKSGFRVISVRGVIRLALVPKNEPVSLVILCHSLAPAEQMAAKAMVHECWPASRVMELVALRQRNMRLDMPSFEVAEGPAAFVRTCKQLAESHSLAS